MGRMVRKQVYIEPRQEELLKRRARELGVPESELIRQAIDQISRTPAVLTPERHLWEEEKAYIEQRMVLPMSLDRRAWEEAKAFIEQRMKMAAPQTGRGWTREELYYERLERFSR